MDRIFAGILDTDRIQVGITTRFYDSANKKASALIALIIKEYHLENK
jgi:hypothetical protein